MKIKNKVRQQASQLFDVLIPEGQWQRYFEMLDQKGSPNRKEMLNCFLILFSQVEKMETLIEDLYFQIELLEGLKNKSDVQEKSEDFKLRTAYDVALEMDTQLHPNTTAFYVTPLDFTVLEKTLDPQLAKNDPNYGYHKEIDPKDGKEKTCLLYRDKPVFRTAE